MLMHDGFNRVNTGLNGSGLSSRNNGYGCKRLVQSVPTSLVNGQVTPGIFARPYTVIGSEQSSKRLYFTCTGADC